MLSILKLLCFIPHNSREVKCVCVFSLWRTRANNLRPTNQCPHSVHALFAELTHSSEHTTVCSHYTLCSQTHTHNSTCSHLCVPFVSRWKSVHSIWFSTTPGRQRPCVSALCFLQLSSCSYTTVTHCHPSGKSSESVWQTYLKSWRASCGSTQSRFAKPSSLFSTDLNSTPD